jgi:hypothetical protein
MYWSPPVVECLVAQRLAEARGVAARQGLLRSLRRPRPSLRAIAGAWLVGAGEQLLRSGATVRPGAVRAR